MKYANTSLGDIMDIFKLNNVMINSGKLSKEEIETVLREQRKIKVELKRRGTGDGTEKQN